MNEQEQQQIVNQALIEVEKALREKNISLTYLSPEMSKTFLHIFMAGVKFAAKAIKGAENE